MYNRNMEKIIEETATKMDHRYTMSVAEWKQLSGTVLHNVPHGALKAVEAAFTYGYAMGCKATKAAKKSAKK